MTTIKTFVQKFTNDWSTNLASMLTYSLITAIFPILAAILTIAALILQGLSPGSLNHVADTLAKVLPAGIVSPRQLLHSLVHITGPLAIVSLVGLLWGGSNLFTNVENAFSIVFRVRDRGFFWQRLMAIGMVVLLAILLPLGFAASSLVTAGSSAFRSVLPPPLGIILTVVGPLVSLGIFWLLFLAIYVVVPNTRIPFRDAWRGALVAAILFGLVTLLFPTYIKVFLHGNARYGATVLTVLVLIAWLWFFAIILMIGAQINAVALGLKPLPHDVARYIAADYAADRTASAPRPRSPVRGASDVEIQPRSDESGRSGRGLAST